MHKIDQEKKAQNLYHKLFKFIDQHENLEEHILIICLLRVAIEKATTGKMGILTYFYLLNKIQFVTTGMMIGTKDSFENIIDEFDPKIFINTKH